MPEALLTRGNGAFLRDTLVRAGLPRADAEETVARLRPAGALTAALNWYRALPLGATDQVGRVRVRTLHVWSDRDGFLGRPAPRPPRSTSPPPTASRCSPA